MAGHVTIVFLNTDHFAETVTYTPYGGSGSSIDAVVMRDPVEAQDALDGSWEAGGARVLVNEDDVSQPARGDTVTVTSPAATYIVNGWQHTEGMWSLTCVVQGEHRQHGSGALT